MSIFRNWLRNYIKQNKDNASSVEVPLSDTEIDLPDENSPEWQYSIGLVYEKRGEADNYN
ncbi:MAG: hypothetical protein EAZ91_23200 [Cytophagales bacterium]|nr:MAG: hypothetical protein EAZ91_23200 [Cytophagales bacterium]